MRERSGSYFPNLGTTVAATLVSLAALITGCQSVPRASEPLDGEAIGIEARALCESADLRVDSMGYTYADGSFTHIGLRCVGDAMSIPWPDYAASIEDFCTAAGQHLSVREITIAQEDGEDPSAEVEFDCR